MLRQFVMWLSAALRLLPSQVLLGLIILGSPIIYMIVEFIIKRIYRLIKNIRK